MTITTDEATGRTKLIAEDGAAVHRKTEPTPSHIVAVVLRDGDNPDNWKDCDLGEPTTEEEATEADKDAALRGFGVEV